MLSGQHPSPVWVLIDSNNADALLTKAVLLCLQPRCSCFAFAWLCSALPERCSPEQYLIVCLDVFLCSPPMFSWSLCSPVVPLQNQERTVPGSFVQLLPSLPVALCSWAYSRTCIQQGENRRVLLQVSLADLCSCCKMAIAESIAEAILQGPCRCC